MPNRPVAEHRPPGPPASRRRPRPGAGGDLAFAFDPREADRLARALVALGFRRAREEAPTGRGVYVIGRHTDDGAAHVFWKDGATATTAAALGRLLPSHAALVEEVDEAGRTVHAVRPGAAPLARPRRRPLVTRRRPAPLGGRPHAHDD